MEQIGEKVISRSATRKNVPKGSAYYVYMKQVVIKTPTGKVNGKQKYSSKTRHVIDKDRK